MRRGRNAASGRVSVPVPAGVRRAAPRRPELVGLEPGASEARVFERLIALGWQEALRAERERARVSVYQAYERDTERQAVAIAQQRAALEGGVL